MRHIYPGHPLTIATAILTKYGANLDSAFETTVHRYPNALTDDDIPGAGGEVYLALDLLDSIRKGRLTVSEAIEDADKTWTYQRTECGYADKLEPGRQEAAALAEDFSRMAAKIEVAP